MEGMYKDYELNIRDVVTPADWIIGPRQGDWTYDTYFSMTEESVLYEIMRGVLIKKPMPDLTHQETAGTMCYELHRFLKKEKLGRMTLPVDVVLSLQDVFQPDLTVVLNKHLDRIGAYGIKGAPDLVIEILMPASKLYDRVNKHMAYEQAGIPEYWMVYPSQQYIELFVLEQGKYRSLGIFRDQQTLPSRIVPQLATPVASFFA